MKIPHYLCCVVALLVLMLAFDASAQDVSDPAFNRFRAQVVGNATTFSYGTGGTPLAGGSSAAGTTVSGGVDVSRGYAVNTRHGPIAGSLTQKISSASMGKAFARAVPLIGGPVGLAFLALPAIVEWMDDAGLDADGSGAVTREVLTRECRVGNPSFSHSFVTASSCASAAQSSLAALKAAGNVHSAMVAWCSSDSVVTVPDCHYNWSVGPGGTVFSVQFTAPAASVNLPASQAEIEAALSSVMSPSPEALAELYRLSEFIPTAHPVPDLVDTLRADFDARSPESVETSTTETPTQEKTTEKTCATYTQIVGSTLSLVENCSTTTTTQPLDPVTGDPVGAPTVETETGSNTTPDPATRPDTEPQAAVCGGPGLPSCNVKVDEAGTPTGETFGESGDLNEALDGRVDGLATARDMAGDTSWGIVPAWTEDQACEPWDIFTLPDAIGGDVVTVDLCPLMPLAEGILNFIWVMLGIFAITSMVASAMTGKAT